MRYRAQPLSESFTDYLPPSPPSRQDLASGTTTATVDFGYATGKVTSSVSSALDKPSGSTASISSTTDTGSAWRVSLTGLTSGEGYRVQLQYTASDGQITYASAEVTVAAGSSGWVTLAAWDFTDAGNVAQSGLGTPGTYTLDLAAGNVSLTTSAVAGVNVPACTASLGASGLDIAVSRASGTGTATFQFSFNLGTFIGSYPDLNINECCIDILMAPTVIPTSGDLVAVELADNATPSSASPGMFFVLARDGSTYEYRSGNRQTTGSSMSAGVSQGTTIPTYVHAQVTGSGYNWSVCADLASSLSAPWAPTTYRGSCGLYALKTPSDSLATFWGAPWVDISVSVANATALAFVVKQIRFLHKLPLAS